MTLRFPTKDTHVTFCAAQKPGSLQPLMRTDALKGRDQKKQQKKATGRKQPGQGKKDKHTLASSEKYGKPTIPANQQAVHILSKAHSESRQSPWKLKI